MVNIIIKCVSEELREKLLSELEGKGNSGTKILIDKIKEAPICGKKGARKRSAYNDFVSSCMKRYTGPVTTRMKSCAVEWKNNKR